MTVCRDEPKFMKNKFDISSYVMFTIRHNGREYLTAGSETTSLDLVWASQKCWFTPGSEVTITNNQTNETKNYIKE